MHSRRSCAPVSDRTRFFPAIIILLGYGLMVYTPAKATEIATLDMESQVFDLDSGTVADAMTEDPTDNPAGADVLLAYNADRTPHAVVFPVAEGVELAFVANVGFDGISSSDVSTLAFSTEPIDLPFSANDCVVVRTDQGTVFKLGNATEIGMSITFNYQPL